VSKREVCLRLTDHEAAFIADALLYWREAEGIEGATLLKKEVRIIRAIEKRVAYAREGARRG
jgi:hypothetical protein